MLPALLLDPLGYHAQAERYLAVFKKHQGTTVPPGKAYQAHPGYLGTPKVYQAINWLSDNGALLWAFSEHALLSGDEQFIEDYTPAIVKSCEWIRDARRITGHGGIEGILPGAVATDEGEQVQSIWNDGWNYKGLTTAVRLLKRIKHPRAAEFEAEAGTTAQRFRAAYREAAQKTPDLDRRGGQSPSHGRRGTSRATRTWGSDHAFYLDCGPLFLVFAGLMDADDELDGRRTGMVPRRAAAQDLPGRRQLLAAAQPAARDVQLRAVLQWVFFHSWQLGDRAKFLEGMYSLFAGASSRQTYTVCETRGGITGVTPCLPGVWLARLAVVDDQIRRGRAAPAAAVPLAWLRRTKKPRSSACPRSSAR